MAGSARDVGVNVGNRCGGLEQAGGPRRYSRGPRRCSLPLPVRLIRRFPADRRRGKAGAGYSANLKRNSKVLDFVKFGGPFLPLLLFSGVGSHVLRAEHGSPEYQGLLFRLRGM